MLLEEMWKLQRERILSIPKFKIVGGEILVLLFLRLLFVKRICWEVVLVISLGVVEILRRVLFHAVIIRWLILRNELFVTEEVAVV